MNSSRTKKAGALLAALAAVLCSAAARAKGPVAGVVTSLEGKPQVKAEGAKEYARLKLNQLVYEGDELKTGAGERVGVAFTGGAEIRVNENSQFLVQAGGGGDKPTTVSTFLGDCWARLVTGHGGPGIRVRAPAAVAAVRGTEADIDVGEHMAVKVYEGLVDVSNGKGTTSLHAGQQTAVAGAGQAPQAARPMSPGDYGNWQNRLKPANMDKSLKLLNDAADRERTLDLNMKGKDGQQKKVRLHFEKK